MPLRSLLYYSTEWANGLASAGAEVLALYPADGGDWALEPGQGIGEAVAEVLKSGVEPRVMPYPPTTNLRYAADNLRAVRNLARTIRRSDPDVLQIQSNRDHRIYAAVRLLRRRCPFVYTVHDAGPHFGEKWEWSRLALHKGYLRHASRIVCLSQAVKRRLVEEMAVEAGRIDVIPHGTHELFRRWMPANAQDDGKAVLFFGRMNKYKGVGVLLDAIPLVRERVPGARFIFAGTGEEVEKRAEDFRRLPDVEVIGRQITTHEVAPLFAQASVVALPYIEASQSGVVTIAYAFDKPVVATNVGGLAEAVEDGKTGLIVPPGDARKLADGLIHLLTDADCRAELSRNIHDLAQGPLSWRELGRQAIETYRRAMEQHKRGRKAD